MSNCAIPIYRDTIPAGYRTYGRFTNIRTFRIALNLLGDGFVEAVADQTLIELARRQNAESGGRFHGQVLFVPIVEAPGHTAVGRFGWKDQHASLLSFSGDAYLNEMGITNRLFPDEVTTLCNTAQEPNSKPGPDGLEDIDKLRALHAGDEGAARDAMLADTVNARRGSELFDALGCAVCHVRSLTTAAAGTKINGGTFTIPQALGGKTFHPFGDFPLHDVGTGDGIVMAFAEHYGPNVYKIRWPYLSESDFQETRNKIRTAPLWGVRLRPRLMHDGASLTFLDAILRHRGEALQVLGDKKRLFEFLRSL